MKARRIVVAGHDIPAKGSGRDFALRGTDEWPESGELLHVVAGGVIRLDVGSTELDLWHYGENGHRTGRVRQQDISANQVVQEKSHSDPNILVDAELGDHAGGNILGEE